MPPSSSQNTFSLRVYLASLMGMVTSRTRARRRRRSCGAAGETPVVDVGHVLGPLPGRKIPIFVETGKPVFWVAGPDDEESPFFLTHGESAGHRLLSLAFPRHQLIPPLFADKSCSRGLQSK
jgi:hypothetical protein